MARVEKLSPRDKAELDLLLALESRHLKQRTFREYVTACRPGYQWYRHCIVLADVLQRVADGELSRVAVFMPPRYGKSEMVSRLFSGYYLERHPDRFVGLNSYAAELAYTLSRNARHYYTRAGNLMGSVEAVKHWETTSGGGLWAAGVGGPITGKGFHLGLIDDPLKNAEEAASETIRAKQKEWYDSTFYTRREPNASMVLIQTRWHEDDLAGYLLAKEMEEAEGWHVVDFPAEAFTEDEPFYPTTCTIEPDWREEGEPLCPERYSSDELRRTRANVGEYFWWALAQQRPRPREGNMFKRAWFEIVPAAPEGRTIRYWDRAATSKDGDWTVGLKMSLAPNKNMYIHDVVRGRWGSAERDLIIRQTAEIDGRACAQRGEQEPGASGKDSSLAFTRMLMGFDARCETVSGDKQLRADPLAAAAGAGLVKLVSGPWVKPFLDELCAFPSGTHDDQVDGASGAFNLLTRKQQIPSVTPSGIRQRNQWRVA